MTLLDFIHALALRLDGLEGSALAVRAQVSDPEMRTVAGAEAQVYGKLRQFLLQALPPPEPEPLPPPPDAGSIRSTTPRPGPYGPNVPAAPMRSAHAAVTPNARYDAFRVGPGTVTLGAVLSALKPWFAEPARSESPLRFTFNGRPVKMDSMGVERDSAVVIHLSGTEPHEPWGAA